jgi:hypothetical protein
MTGTGFAFVTNAGHPLDPGNIAFNIYAGTGGQLTMSINLSGSFSSIAKAIGFNYLGGSQYENGFWNHLLGTVAADCNH